MPNREMPLAAPARDSSVEINFRVETHSETNDNVSSSKNSAKIETKHEESSEERIEKIIEGRAKRNAFNNRTMYEMRVAAAERRRKRHGKVIDLSDIES
jgi:hypothetical protein